MINREEIKDIYKELKKAIYNNNIERKVELKYELSEIHNKISIWLKVRHLKRCLFICKNIFINLLQIIILSNIIDYRNTI